MVAKRLKVLDNRSNVLISGWHGSERTYVVTNMPNIDVCRLHAILDFSGTADGINIRWTDSMRLIKLVGLRRMLLPA